MEAPSESQKVRKSKIETLLVVLRGVFYRDPVNGELGFF